MTCTVGIVADGVVYIGSDSLMSEADNRINHARPKVFKLGNILVGYSGPIRQAQIMEHLMSAPERVVGQDTFTYAVLFAGALRTLISEHTDSASSGGLDLLLGIDGRLFQMQEDYSIIEPTSGEYAIGSGGFYALGSLHTSRTGKPGNTPRGRIKFALDAASAHCPAVKGPYTILDTKPE